jgi:peptide deformylase
MSRSIVGDGRPVQREAGRRGALAQSRAMASAPDPAAAARRAAAFERIRQWGDPVLRSRAREVDEFDDALRRQAEEMVRVMEAAHGAGLAAPQVGVTNRVLVYRPDPETAPRALVNPVVEEASEDTARDLEGCLSLGRAQVHVEVERPRAVVVAARDVDGEEVRIEAEDRHARVLQHEIDHLDGVLMLARADPEQRKAAVRALREGVPYSPPPPPEEESGGRA